MTEKYDRLAAGKRIRARRRLLGLTQEEMAERIGRVPKYYADIERGNCGMSVETLLALAKTLDLSLDYIILGEGKDGAEAHKDEVAVILDLIDRCQDKRRDYAMRLLKLFLAALDE